MYFLCGILYIPDKHTIAFLDGDEKRKTHTTESFSNSEMKIAKGRLFPFGASYLENGMNFALYAKEAQTVALCLFQQKEDEQPSEKFDMHRTGDIWHIFVQDLHSSFAYGYEVKKKDKTHLILDPYAKCILSGAEWQKKSRKESNYRPLGKVVLHHFDWENDQPPNIPKNELIIYEMHVRGFTRHPSSKVQFPATFRGMVEKIPHLLDLGINAVELMPIQEFCEEDLILSHPDTDEKLHNYFGYATINFFSPMNRYASQSFEDGALVEFKTLVKELHKNGIEVILDVTFNHTMEGNEQGPILSYKGLDPKAYYILNDKNQYMNFSGCGNTFNCNHPVTMELIIQALRHWVIEYHVDGFRFDLASVFNRGRDGTPLESSPLMQCLSEDPVLSAIKLIAEPWDPGGLYQIGKFASFGPRWSEWNGDYQKSVRKFIKGNPNSKSLFANALTGSANHYPFNPFSGVNYITAHDGFTLADLVSYNSKHNLANGENNNDGTNDNESWNCGYEGETENKKVLNLRQRQMRNFHLTLMLSHGIPMLLMGDEYGHTKKGNNNPWCQDNELNWFLWDQIEKSRDFNRFFKLMIAFRKKHPLLKNERHWTDQEMRWHGINPEQPDWEKENHFIAFSLHDPTGHSALYAAFNASQIYQNVVIPPPNENKNWLCVVNTKNKPPFDFMEEPQPISLNAMRLAPYSSILLKSP